MRSRLPTLFLSLTLACGAVAGPHPARATLGEPAASIARDREALSAAHRATTARGSYTVQEAISPSTAIREYVNASGVVFAVAWKGLMPPDLTPLLGRYFPEYQDAARRVERVPGHRRSHVQGNRVVVERWGHMRALQGRAYLPALLPSGVTVDEIQ